jgi:hypothetical protein
MSEPSVSGRTAEADEEHLHDEDERHEDGCDRHQHVPGEEPTDACLVRGDAPDGDAPEQETRSR